MLLHVQLFGVAQSDETDEILRLVPGANLFPRAFPSRWFRGRGLREALHVAAKHLDVLHVHMLWDHTLVATWQAARSANLPFVITPHGSVIAPWRHSSWHKRAYKALLLDRILAETSVVHVLSKVEEIACREFGITCPIRVIPNGLPRSDFELERCPDLATRHWPEIHGRRVMLYLGRLCAEKGLDILVEAWARMLTTNKSGSDDWLLVIAGPDYREYKEKLNHLIASLNVDRHVLVSEPVSGELKSSLLGAADCFILPSRSEGFSMALLEAMAAGIPAVYSTECNFPELAECGGGWEIPVQIEELLRVLTKVSELPLPNLNEIGEKGRSLGRKKYTLDKVATQLVSMYTSICP
jgi:glycosyltransferase involved in cell wall biosynthesis